MVKFININMLFTPENISHGSSRGSLGASAPNSSSTKIPFGVDWCGESLTKHVGGKDAKAKAKAAARRAAKSRAIQRKSVSSNSRHKPKSKTTRRANKHEPTRLSKPKTAKKTRRADKHEPIRLSKAERAKRRRRKAGAKHKPAGNARFF